MKRAFDKDHPELMDKPQPVSAELEQDLKNLIGLNRYFGSHRLVRRFLSAWLLPGRCYHVLDLATGAGDIPRIMVDWARARGITLQVDAVDAHPSTLEIARKLSGGYPEIRFTQGDVLTYESPAAYDLVCCSLALHHFSDEDAARLLRRCRELSNRYVLVSDLERCAATTFGVWAVTEFIFTDPMTRYDGRLSAERAFSFAEMAGLAEQAGWRNHGHARFLFCRQALWLDEHTLGDIPEPIMNGESLPCPT
ncbi:MAG: SAM-dependent methyltransferase [Chthoniobacteraceae bacterium]|nr:SAM-dependent methyltransferase [Chthoniobacteraceae bacterium]